MALDTAQIAPAGLLVAYQSCAGDIADLLRSYITRSGRLQVSSSILPEQAAVVLRLDIPEVIPHPALEVTLSCPHDMNWSGRLAARYQGPSIEALARSASRAIKHALAASDGLEDSVIVATAHPHKGARTGSKTILWIIDPLSGTYQPWYKSSTVLCCPEWIEDVRGGILVVSQHVADAVRLVALRPGKPLIRLLEGPGTLTSLCAPSGLHDFVYCRSGSLWHVHKTVPGNPLSQAGRLESGLYDRPQLQPGGGLYCIKDGAVIFRTAEGKEQILVPATGCSGLSWPLGVSRGVFARLHEGHQSIWQVDARGAVQLMHADPGVSIIDPRMHSNGMLVAAIRCKEGTRDLMCKDLISGKSWYITLEGYSITGLCWARRAAILDKKGESA